MDLFTGGNPEQFHIGQHDDPPELPNLKHFVRATPVPLRSTNQPARAVSAAQSFAFNSTPTVNTINPGARYFRR